MTYSIPQLQDITLSAKPEIQHLEVERGVDYMFTYSYKDKVTGLPINLTPYMAAFTVVSRSDLSTPKIAKLSTDASSGLTIPTPANGQVSVLVKAADTSAIMDISLEYNLVLTDTSGVKTKVLKGFLTLFNTDGA